MTYEELYRKMCKSCPYSKKCHEACEECEEFLEKLDASSN